MARWRGGGGGVPTEICILYQKNPNFSLNLSTQKNPYFFCIPQNIPQCFLYQQILLQINHILAVICTYAIVHLIELMKNATPKKIPVFFLQPKKILEFFIDPKKSLLATKICERGPWTMGSVGIKSLSINLCVFTCFKILSTFTNTVNRGT